MTLPLPVPRSAIAASLIGLCACAASTSPAAPGPGTGSPTSEATTRRLIADARVRIDSAIREGSLGPALSLIDDSSRITMAGGAELRGREHIEATLVGEAARVRVSGIQFTEPRYEPCVDGAIEWRSRYLVPLSRDGVADTLRGPYAIRWIVEGDGSLRLRHLALGNAALDASFRRPCISQWWNTMGERTSFANRRLMIWFPVMVDRPALIDDLDERFRGQGYGTGHLSPSLRDYSGTREDDAALAGGAIGLRYEIRAPFSLDVVASSGPPQSTFQAYNADTITHVSLTHDGSYIGAMLAMRWRYLRVGAGPLAVRGEWYQRESAIEQDPESGSWFLRSTPTEEQWRSVDLGLIAQGSLLAPVTTFLSLEGFAMYRVAKSDIRATPRRGALEANVGGLGAGFALGFHF